ncbi:MAG: DUF4190 domain-containing protein [Phycisphaerae bacterium]
MNSCESNQETPRQIYIKTSGLAIGSFVLGLLLLLLIGSILSVTFLKTNYLAMGLLALPIFLFVASPLALILGLIAKRKIKKSDGTLRGREMAIAGAILGTFFWVPWLAVCLWCFSQLQQVHRSLKYLEYPKSTKLTFPPVEPRLEQMEARKNNLPDKYAVIINGDDSKHHIRNVSLAHNVLKQNGFMDKNIFVLSYQKNTADEQIRTYAPTFGNLQMVFRFLSDTIDEKDFLFIYGTGHGIRKEDVSEISIRRICPGCKCPHLTRGVSEIEFEYLIRKIHPQYTVLVFDQCEAGGFGTKLQGRENFVVVCRAAQHERGTCKYFAKAFFDAFGDTSCDADNNGRISIAEAFSKTLQTVNQIDAGYQKHRYTPSIKGSLDANTIYLNSRVDKNNEAVK